MIFGRYNINKLIELGPRLSICFGTLSIYFSGTHKKGDDQPMYFENFNLVDPITPVDVDTLERLLKDSYYSEAETSFLVNGFRYGFELGYTGPKMVKQSAHNLKIRVGNETILWNKVMKEVKLKRFAGPYNTIPFEYYIQSPIGLVPKGEDDTRLIFHLSYPQNGNSVNAGIPKDKYSVVYKDFSQAIQACLELGIGCKLSKLDMKSAFRILCMRPDQFWLLVLKAKSPIDGKTYYFIDKCLPFGSSISCAHFQRFLDAVAHLVRHRLGLPQKAKIPVNYLDDFLFTALTKALCDGQLDTFLAICAEINFPVSMDKTFWSTSIIVFLGLLIDAERQIVAIPVDKVERATHLIQDILARRTTTVKSLQRLTGYPNFL